jgi:coenzyme PQQ precursor peptide PqqA
VATLIAAIPRIHYTFISTTYSPLEVTMQQSSWTTPDFEEISLNCEINSYAPVEL